MNCPMCDSKMKLMGFKLKRKHSLVYWCKKCSVGYKPHELLVRRKEEVKRNETLDVENR